MHGVTKTTLGGIVVSAALLSGLTTAASHPSTDPPPQFPPFELVSLSVVNATTVDAAFSNPLDASITAIPSSVFHVPHFDHKVPHAHDVTAVTLLNDRTVRVTLARGLHSDNPPCDTDEPRCSKDPLPFIISQAKDVFGQTLTDDDFEVLATGVKD